MSISLVAAVAKNNVIGRANALPWYIPEDLKRFKKLTTGHAVLMGNKTYESIVDRLGKPLPNRLNIVLSKDPGYKVASGVALYHNLQQALEAYKSKDLYIIGGGSVFQQTINLADKLYITHVYKNVDGDVFFPAIDPKIWEIAEDEPYDGFGFATYIRKAPPSSNL